MNIIYMMKGKKILIIILSALTVLTLGFIWVNSCIPPETSVKGSDTVYNGVVDAVGGVLGQPAADKFSETVSEGVFRKLIHFFEFAALGVEFMLLYKLTRRFDCLNYVELCIAGVLVAIVDECLQIFSARGAAVKDVLIDASGYYTACAITAAIIFLISFIKSKKTKTTE